MQEKYFDFFVQIKILIFYLGYYTESSYKWERRINVFIAITSSTSIAAWAIWREFDFLWAVLIASSQVIIAINPHLPFSERLKKINIFKEQLKIIYNDMEYKWFAVSNGELTDSEINNLLYKFKDKYRKMESENLKEEMLLENKKFVKLANEKTEKFFEDNF